MEYLDRELYIELGKRLRYERELRDATMNDVAEKIGVTTMTIQRYEMGTRKINVETIRSICSYLGIDADTLMQDTINSLCTATSLSNEEQTLLGLFNGLNDEGKEKLIEYAHMLESFGYIKSNKPELVEEEA